MRAVHLVTYASWDLAAASKSGSIPARFEKTGRPKSGSIATIGAGGAFADCVASIAEGLGETLGVVSTADGGCLSRAGRCRGQACPLDGQPDLAGGNGNRFRADGLHSRG